MLITADAINTLSYPFNAKLDNLQWIDSEIALPCRNLSEFGSILCRHQFIVCFGGIIEKNKKIDDIFILDIECNKWTQSQIKCPSKSGFHAVYVNKSESVHLFERNKSAKDELFEHWVLSLSDIFEHTVPFDPICSNVQSEQNGSFEAESDEIKNAEEYDDGKRVEKRRKNVNDFKIESMQKEIVGIKEEISLIWDFITSLKNDMMQIKENQMEIIQNTQQNSQRIIDYHQNVSSNYVKKDELKDLKVSKKRKKKKPKTKSIEQRKESLVVDQNKKENASVSKSIYNIFDSDIDEEEEEKDVVQIEKIVENENENGTIVDTKNLSLITAAVEYESIDEEKTESEQENNDEKDKEKELKQNEMKEMKEWLTKNRLSEYYPIFIEKGYLSLKQLMNLDDNALLTQMGMSKLVHRRKLMAKLRIYKKQTNDQ